MGRAKAEADSAAIGLLLIGGNLHLARWAQGTRRRDSTGERLPGLPEGRERGL